MYIAGSLVYRERCLDGEIFAEVFDIFLSHGRCGEATDIYGNLNPLGRKDELRGVSIFVDQVRMNGLVL